MFSMLTTGRDGGGFKRFLRGSVKLPTALGLRGVRVSHVPWHQMLIYLEIGATEQVSDEMAGMA